MDGSLAASDKGHIKGGHCCDGNSEKRQLAMKNVNRNRSNSMMANCGLVSSFAHWWNAENEVAGRDVDVAIMTNNEKSQLEVEAIATLGAVVDEMEHTFATLGDAV